MGGTEQSEVKAGVLPNAGTGAGNRVAAEDSTIGFGG